MPGINNKPLTGYYETEYASEWPGLVTNIPSSRIPAGACISCNAMVVRGRLTPQPSLFAVTGTAGMTVSMPTFAPGENVCAVAQLQPPQSQQGFTVIITNMAVYVDYNLPTTINRIKTFVSVFTFPVAYGRYARFGTCVIGNTLYFSSASQLGLYALRPTFSVASVQVTNPGGYFTSTPTVLFSDGAGTGATGVATLSGSNLASIAITNGGSGYVTPPIVSLNGGSVAGPTAGQGNAAAVGILSASPISYIVQEVSAFTGVASINVTSMGSGYVNPQVNFVGGGGTGATGTAVIAPNNLGGTNGVYGIQMDSPGQNYTSPPTVIITDAGGSGSGAAATAVLFQGKPFIGGDFMTSLSERLVLGNIIGGDGNNTVGVADVVVTNGGGGYSEAVPADYPLVQFVGGGGSGAVAYIPSTAPFTSIAAISMGQFDTFTGNTTAGSDHITNVNPLTGLRIGESVFNVGVFPGNTKITDIQGSTVTTAANAAILQTPGFFQAFGYFAGNSGSGYYSTPAVSIVAPIGSGATAIAQLSNVPAADSSATRFPDRIAWSAPNAFGYFDPNYLIAPGGFNTISEARGLIASVNVVESVAFVGHNGGITEMTPNTSSAEVPFAFYPLWSADEGVLVRYGSMAQYGSTLAFLAEDSAYTMTPNGLSEIGMNIANLLQADSSNNNLSSFDWNNGNYPLQGLYGSIVLIEGQKHYLIGTSADDVDFRTNNVDRVTNVFDFNMAENSWHYWSWSGYTLTCPIYQSFDLATYSPNAFAGNIQIAADEWILMPLTVSTGSSVPFSEQATVYEIAPLSKRLQLMGISVNPVIESILAYQFRTEAPSIARMQQERRIGVEYENQTELAAQTINPTLTLTYTGQQDPTSQTGTVSQNQVCTQVLNQLDDATIVDGQILTSQIDFGTFTGVCTTLGLTASGTNSLVALVRLTQVATLPKAEIT